ncbi:hypothetical protein CDL12_10736 [Handroanthus impetiginosus]|uniref:CCHC-type domain-containing protein n=1 Tax=Handroanthus impetiginosus TaxID=429701 RepID=A0A2G9HGD7_9LAMI|nr:hypothetical protein CDL12_10736 [Handroanthus impetiginosus]
MFKITSQLKLCGENLSDGDMLEKTFSTFHASNLLLQQQYREKGFKKYSELISCLLVAEQNNELLMKNHESRSTGSSPFPEMNATNFSSSDRAHGHSHDHGGSRGRGRHNYRNYDNGNHGSFYHKSKEALLKKGDFDEKKLEKSSKDSDNSCFRCGAKGHWSRICRTLKHLVELYQASLKKKKKSVEGYFTNSIDDFHNDANDVDIAYLDVANFFEDSEGKIDHLIGDGNVQNN